MSAGLALGPGLKLRGRIAHSGNGSAGSVVGPVGSIAGLVVFDQN